MATQRGIAKQDLKRAINNARRITQRVSYLAETHKEFTEWSEGIKTACGTAEALGDYLGQLLEALP